MSHRLEIVASVATHEVEEVAWLVAKRAAAIRAADAEYLAARYAPGASTFGFAPPLAALAGTSADVAALRAWFAAHGPVIYAPGPLTVSASDGLAVCHSVDVVASGRPADAARSGGLGVGRRRLRASTRLDVTLGYERIGGRWLLTCECVRVLPGPR